MVTHRRGSGGDRRDSPAGRVKLVIVKLANMAFRRNATQQDPIVAMPQFGSGQCHELRATTLLCSGEIMIQPLQRNLRRLPRSGRIVKLTASRLAARINAWVPAPNPNQNRCGAALHD